MNAIKLVYKSTTELYQPNQPPEIAKLFKQPEHKYRTRLTENPNNIKMHRNYKKEQAAFNIIQQWNQANNNTWNSYKNYGNLYILKKAMTMKMLEEIKTCTKKKCKTCEIDEHRNYEKYVKR